MKPNNPPTSTINELQKSDVPENFVLIDQIARHPGNAREVEQPYMYSSDTAQFQAR